MLMKLLVGVCVLVVGYTAIVYHNLTINPLEWPALDKVGYINFVIAVVILTLTCIHDGKFKTQRNS